MTAKTNAKCQQDYRARKHAMGQVEVRGIFAPPEHHAAIKAQVVALLTRKQPKRKHEKAASIGG